MAKKEKTPLTFEELARKKEWKEAKSKLFERFFLKSFALFTALAVVYFVVTIAFLPPAEVAPAQQAQEQSADENKSGSNNSGSNQSQNNSSNSNSATPASTDNNTASDSSDNNGSAPSSDSNSSSSDKPASSGMDFDPASTDQVIDYFNNAINKVKPDAKKIVLVVEKNTQAGSIEGLPSALSGMANNLISGNMGEKNQNTEVGSNDFPVENETWSSKLTAADVKKCDVQANDQYYQITIETLDDDPSEQTAHGYGHNGKVFSVISPSIVTDNAGPAASIIKSVKTGHKNGRIVALVERSTGNVTRIDYYFEWTLSVNAMGMNVTVPFGLEKEYQISY